MSALSKVLNNFSVIKITSCDFLIPDRFGGVRGSLLVLHRTAVSGSPIALLSLFTCSAAGVEPELAPSLFCCKQFIITISLGHISRSKMTEFEH